MSIKPSALDAIGSPTPTVRPPQPAPPLASTFPASAGERKHHPHHSSAFIGAPYGAAVKYYSNKVAAAWAARPARERRAIAFIAVFVGLVTISVAQAVDTPSPAVAHSGILPHIGLQAGGVLFADVNQYNIVAVADNDGSLTSPTAPPAAAAPTADGGPPPNARRDPATAVITGHLSFNPASKQWSVEWGGAPQWISAMFAVGGRGMELSTLQYWRDDKLYACDDRTGIVYEVTVYEHGAEPTAVPRFILPDGNGNVGRGMRCEWSTVKGDFLYIGSTGKPRIDFRTRGVLDTNALWAKTISPVGEVRHMDWAQAYAKLRGALGITNPDGYAIHECAAWSRVHRSWVFVPRHVSNAAYTPDDENKHGSTVLVITDATFRSARTVPLPPMRSGSVPYGVTECKFVPNGRDDALVIVKSVTRADGAFDSAVAMVALDGRLIMDDMPMPAGFQFEALELRPVLHSNE